MAYTTQDYREFIRTSPRGGYELVEVDNDHFELQCPWAMGLVTFWQVPDTEEVVELSIVRTADSTAAFFLHFQVKQRAHAEQLFNEMVDALLSLAERQATKIILSCSAGITTTYFVSRLNETAQNLGLPYEFSALSADHLAGNAHDCAAVLLAPQVAYRHKEIAQTVPGVRVLDIPAKIFGAYDTAACLAFVNSSLSDRSISDGITEDIQATITDSNVLVITSFYNARQTRIVWRLYVQGSIFLQGSNMKRELSLHDIEDVVDVIRATTDTRIDKLVLTVPGVFDDGVLQMDAHAPFVRGFDVHAYFKERYPFEVLAANNVNAAALGWYALQNKYHSVVLHSQPRGNLLGGQGLVANGRLIRGNRGAAGEISLLMPLLLGTDTTDISQFDDIWDSQTTLRAIALELAANIAVFAPEVIVIRSALTPDVDEIRSEIAKLIPENLIPDLVHVDSFDDFCLHGALLMGIGVGID